MNTCGKVVMEAQGLKDIGYNQYKCRNIMSGDKNVFLIRFKEDKYKLLEAKEPNLLDRAWNTKNKIKTQRVKKVTDEIVEEIKALGIKGSYTKTKGGRSKKSKRSNSTPPSHKGKGKVKKRIKKKGYDYSTINEEYSPWSINRINFNDTPDMNMNNINNMNMNTPLNQVHLLHLVFCVTFIQYARDIHALCPLSV